MNENIATIGINIPSMCSFCLAHIESSDHIFLRYQFADNIWGQLSTILSHNLWDIDDCWEVLKDKYSTHCNLVVLEAIINTFNVIWLARNNLRFNNIITHWKMTFNAMIVEVSCAVILLLKHVLFLGWIIIFLLDSM